METWYKEKGSELSDKGEMHAMKIIKSAEDKRELDSLLKIKSAEVEAVSQSLGEKERIHASRLPLAKALQQDEPTAETTQFIQDTLALEEKKDLEKACNQADKIFLNAAFSSEELGKGGILDALLPCFRPCFFSRKDLSKPSQ